MLISDNFTDFGNQQLYGFAVSSQRVVVVNFSDADSYTNKLDATITLTITINRVMDKELDFPIRLLYLAQWRSEGNSGTLYTDFRQPTGFGYKWNAKQTKVDLFYFEEGRGILSTLNITQDELTYLCGRFIPLFDNISLGVEQN